MLPSAARLRRGDDIRLVVRRGRRIHRGPVTLHVLLAPPGAEPHPAEAGWPQVAVVVGKALGGAVERNLVRRRLREAMRHRLGLLPPGARAVIRVEPSARTTAYAELSTALERCLTAAATR